jgi:spore coat protein U-like protein
MTKYSLSVTIFLAITLAIIGPGRSLAGTATASLAVSATVDAVCSITTTPLTFPDYLELGANQTTPDDGTGTITATCTAGAAPTIGLSLGANSTGTQAQMTNGVSYLAYGIYQDANRTIVWGNAAPNLRSLGTVPNNNPQLITVYGRIPAGQAPQSGAYTDTVQATINF